MSSQSELSNTWPYKELAIASAPTEKKRPAPLQPVRQSSEESITSLKLPRTPRFAEATTVYSPIEASEDSRSPFADPPKFQSYMAQSQPSDIGFGYISENDPSMHTQGVPVEFPVTPGSPLKSAMRIPGTPGRRIDNPLSPTFREEQILEKHEDLTEKEQVKDLKVKTRIRVAKFLLRGVNFSCSLIVLAMVSVTFHIFNATKHLPARNNLPVWAVGTKTWPQYLVLAISCISLLLCLVVFWNYWRGGHARAEKVAVYYTLFAVGYFIFSTIMWGVAAGVLQGIRSNSNNKDIWGWSCIDNKRHELFKEEVDYALVCRVQNWALVCCIVEIVLECITIILYAVVFYRYYSKQRLRKSMDVRDRARSDLYLAQLRSQSAPNTPGFGPLSPSYSSYAKSPRFPPSAYAANNGNNSESDAEEGFGNNRFVEAKSGVREEKKPFALQPPPIKIHSAMPKMGQGAFEQQSGRGKERVIEHVDAAPGEQTYDAVPIPGAYASPERAQGMGHQRYGSVGEAITSGRRIESPPGSPRGRDD